MKYTVKVPILAAILLLCVFVTTNAQPTSNSQLKGKTKIDPGVPLLLSFGAVKDWRPNPTLKHTAPQGVKPTIVLSATDPIIGETDNYFRFVVVPNGLGKVDEFSISVFLNDIAHMLLSSKEAYHDAKGFYFQFSPSELGPLPKGKHKLMLVIDHGKSSLVRNSKNQHSAEIVVK